MGNDIGVGELRASRALVASSALLLSLLFVRARIPALSHALSARITSPGVAAGDVTWEIANPANELAPVFGYGLTIAAALAGVAIAILLHRLSERRSSARRILASASALAAVTFAYFESRPLGHVVVILLFASTVFLIPYAGIGQLCARSTSPTRLAMAALLTEVFALTWGFWLITAPRGLGPVAVIPLGLAIAVVFASVGIALARKEGGSTLQAYALGGLPFLGLPLLGLLRAPSPVWLALAVLGGDVFRRLAVRFPERARVIVTWVALVAAPFALFSALVVPLGFRGLPSENFGSHEGFHAGWINSAYHGELLMADASFIYGPLREYVLAALVLLGGPSLAHLRMAHLSLNLLGLGLMVATGRWVTRGKLGVQLWLAYVVATATPLRTFVSFPLYTCFGWVDLLRAALPLFALVAMIRAVGFFPTTPGVRRNYIQVAAWSFLVGCAFLYSQEYGAVAALAGAFAVMVHRLVRAEGSVGTKVVDALKTGALVTISAGAPFALLILVYSFFGKAGLLVRATFRFGALVSSGKINAYPFPVSSTDFLDPWGMTRAFIEGQVSDTRYHDANVEYIIVAGIVIVAFSALAFQAAWRRWTVRSSILLGMTLFTAATYRITLSRGDPYHVFSATPGACLIAAMMLADASSLSLTLRGAPFPRASLGWIAASGVVAFSLLAGECNGGIHSHALAIASGALAPVPATKYEYPLLRRAGDILVSAGTQHLIEFIDANTQRTDPIFCRIDMMRGGEIYFLANRRDATPFDTIHEITTPAMQSEVARALRANLPELVIGTDESYIGKEASDFLREAYEPIKNIDGYAVARRRRPH